MARLSASQASDEVEEDSVSAEGVADSEEEGAMEEQATPKRRRLNADARHSNGNPRKTAQQGAMGQGESRETLKERSAAIRRAGQEALQPPRGKLKHPSGASSLAPRIPLANRNTYHLSDDNEEDALSTNVRRTPIRHPKPTQNASYTSLADAQAQIDLQFQMEQDEVGAESEGHEQEEPVVEQPQQSGSGKKRRGRPPNPPKPVQMNDQTMHADPGTPDTAAAPKRRVGRPTKAEAAAAAAAARAGSTANAQQPSNTPAQANRRRSARVSGNTVEPTPEPAEQAASKGSASNTRQLRNGADQAVTSNIGRRVRARVNNHSNEQQQTTQPMNSASQPMVIDDEQGDDQVHETNEEAEEDDDEPQGSDVPEENFYFEENAEPEEDDEDHEPQGNDGPDGNFVPEENNEPEQQPEPSDTDSHRLHGQWGLMQGIWREARRHSDETPDISDDTFNATLRACKDSRAAVRAIPAGISPDELIQITTECRNSVRLVEALCRDTSDVRNRDERGYHIFKFLMPALAKLLKAEVEALERVDIEGAGLPQISMAHLPIVMNLIHGINTCGLEAYHAYTRLDHDRPVKRDVHSRITIPLRNLHTALEGIYQRRAATEMARVQADAIAAEEAARDEEHERLEEWRETVTRNQAKWKKMDTVRRELVLNSIDTKKRNHIYKCPSTLVVETAEDGRPFLDPKWRKEVTTFTMRELVALREGLILHVDTPDPLKSEVFENLIKDYCRYKGELAERNTLEIVRQAGDMRASLIKLYKDNGTQPPRWVWKVPVWMEPAQY
jgi:hypothetical protein